MIRHQIKLWIIGLIMIVSFPTETTWALTPSTIISEIQAEHIEYVNDYLNSSLAQYKRVSSQINTYTVTSLPKATSIRLQLQGYASSFFQTLCCLPFSLKHFWFESLQPLFGFGPRIHLALRGRTHLWVFILGITLPMAIFALLSPWLFPLLNSFTLWMIGLLVVGLITIPLTGMHLVTWSYEKKIPISDAAVLEGAYIDPEMLHIITVFTELTGIPVDIILDSDLLAMYKPPSASFPKGRLMMNIGFLVTNQDPSVDKNRGSYVYNICSTIAIKYANDSLKQQSPGRLPKYKKKLRSDSDKEFFRSARGKEIAKKVQLNQQKRFRNGSLEFPPLLFYIFSLSNENDYKPHALSKLYSQFNTVIRTGLTRQTQEKIIKIIDTYHMVYFPEFHNLIPNHYTKEIYLKQIILKIEKVLHTLTQNPKNISLNTTILLGKRKIPLKQVVSLARMMVALTFKSKREISGSITHRSSDKEGNMASPKTIPNLVKQFVNNNHGIIDSYLNDPLSNTTIAQNLESLKKDVWRVLSNQLDLVTLILSEVQKYPGNFACLLDTLLKKDKANPEEVLDTLLKQGKAFPEEALDTLLKKDNANSEEVLDTLLKKGNASPEDILLGLHFILEDAQKTYREKEMESNLGAMDAQSYTQLSQAILFAALMIQAAA